MVSDIVKSGLLATTLENRAKPKMQKLLENKDTKLVLKIEEINEKNSVAKLKFSWFDVEITKGLVFYKIKRFRDDDDYVTVYTSEHILNNRTDDTEFDEFEIQLTLLCNGDEYKPLRLELYEWTKKGKHKIIGTWDFSLWDINTDKKVEHRLLNDRNIIGMIRCVKWQVDTKFTFLDYIFGGCDIEVVIAIDFTLTNKSINNPRSLHHIPSDDHDNFYIDDEGKKVPAKNYYYKAIKKLWEIVSYYDTDSYIPVYGFGAKLPPYYNSVSHLFALNGNIFEPEIDGVEGVWDNYKKMIKNISFHGPSAMAPLIRFTKDFTSFEKNDKSHQHYTILLVFTNGELSDLQSTIDEVVLASKTPLSIIFVGVGKDEQNFKTLTKLDADKKNLVSSSGEKASRDIVQFVDYWKHKNKFANLVKETLKEIPKQFIDYMDHNNIKPLDHEAKNKNKLKFKDLEQMKKEVDTENKVKETSPFFWHLKEQFIKDCLSLGFEEKAILELIEQGVMSTDINFAFEFLTTQQKEAKDKEKEERIKKKKIAETKLKNDEEWNVPNDNPSEEEKEPEEQLLNLEDRIIDNGVFFKRRDIAPPKKSKPPPKYMLY